MDMITYAIHSESDVMITQIRARKYAEQLGFSKTIASAISIVVSELGHNIVVYAKEGTLSFTTLEQNNENGMMIIAEDHGPGIDNIEQALKDGYSTGGSLGIGLPAVKRLMDEFEIETTKNQGTKIIVKKWIKHKSKLGSSLDLIPTKT